MKQARGFVFLIAATILRSNVASSRKYQDVALGAKRADEPVYLIALSTGYRPNLTSLKKSSNSSIVVTAGNVTDYAIQGPPDLYSRFLTGRFVAVNNNTLVPNNRGLRKAAESEGEWVIGKIIHGNQCLKASLERPYLVLADCGGEVLRDRSLAWINWGPIFDAGLGGNLQPFGHQSTQDFIKGRSPSQDKSWGVAHKNLNTVDQLIVMSEYNHSMYRFTAQLKVIYYSKTGYLVTGGCAGEIEYR